MLVVSWLLFELGGNLKGLNVSLSDVHVILANSSQSWINALSIKQLSLETCKVLQCPLFPVSHSVLKSVTPCLIRTKETENALSQHEHKCSYPGLCCVPFTNICLLSLFSCNSPIPVPSLPCLVCLSLITLSYNGSVLRLLRSLSRFFLEYVATWLLSWRHICSKTKQVPPSCMGVEKVTVFTLLFSEALQNK